MRSARSMRFVGTRKSAGTGWLVRQRGMTLIELVVAIVVIGVAVAGVSSVMNLATAKSADPVLATQAQAIARAYLEEVLARDYTDPDGSELGEDRATFDDVDDYHGLIDNGCLATSPGCPVLGDCACDQYGAPLESLAGYGVSVTVATTLLNAAPAMRVEVTVTHVGLPELRVDMGGYRAPY